LCVPRYRSTAAQQRFSLTVNSGSAVRRRCASSQHWIGPKAGARSGRRGSALDLAPGAILLDVDNGPEGMTRRANDSLCSRAGLNAARVVLTKRGVLALWSSGPNRDFAYRLRRSGFNVEERVVRATSSGCGARHIIWIGTSGGSPQVEIAVRLRP
jgi:hypothetical protein